MFTSREKVNTGTTSLKVYTDKDYDETFKIPRAILKLVGLRLARRDSTYIRLSWNIFYWFEFLNLFVVTVLEVTQMVKTARGGSFQDAVEIFRMMPCVGYLLLAMAKSYKIVYYRPVNENLVQELRGMWPRGSVSIEEHLIISTSLKNLNYVVKGYYWCNNILLVVFLLPSFLDMIKRAIGYDVPPFLPFFYWFPFNPFQKVYFEIILLAQFWHALITIWFMLCGDLLFCIFVSHITMQFDLLSVRIRRLFLAPPYGELVDTYSIGNCYKDYEINKKMVIEKYNNKNWEMEYEEELNEIIIQHSVLVRLSADVQDMFGFALLVNFCNSSIIICFCGFCCMIVEKWNEMVYKSFLITALSQTWLLCWYGQRLLESVQPFLVISNSIVRVYATELLLNDWTDLNDFFCMRLGGALDGLDSQLDPSAGVSDALYACGWYKVSKKITSSILIMLHRTQKNVHVTTYGFSVISLASYALIIKTAWSYFTLLLNIYKQ